MADRCMFYRTVGLFSAFLVIFATAMNKNNIYLKSKPRYEILDGLRGVAAMLVVVFHIFEGYASGVEDYVISHGYLAVDFFFVLSGFVVGYAYDDRWGSMSVWNFCKRRLVRLHPMVVFGMTLGLFCFYLGAGDKFPLISETSWYMVLLMYVLGCLMIPATPSMDIRGWGETYSLNGPAWSLMFEYIANLLYALFIRRLSKTGLALCVAFFAFLTVNLCLNIDVFGILEPHEWAAYTVIGGWGLDGVQLFVGFTRLLYPFFMGLLLARMNKLISLRGSFWWCAGFVSLLLAIPHVGTGDTSWLNGLYECLCILALFPLIVAVGAGSNISDKRTEKACKFLGEVSYPLYIIHYPLIYLQMAWLQRNENAPLGQHIIIGVGLFVASVAIAYAAYKLYDVPVREWLKGKLFVVSKTNE